MVTRRGTLNISVRLRRVGGRIEKPWAATHDPSNARSWSYGETAWEAIAGTIQRAKFRKRG